MTWRLLVSYFYPCVNLLKINSLTRQHDSHKTFCESYTLLHNHLCSAMKARHLIVYTKVQVFRNQHMFLLFPLFHLKRRIFKTFKYLQMKISFLNPMLKQHVKNKHVHIIFYCMQKHETTCYIHVSKQVHFIYTSPTMKSAKRFFQTSTLGIRHLYYNELRE